MKREIKFRCWDVKGQKMFFPKDIPNDLICSVPEDDDEQFFVHMQFTGLKDDKKVDIYEGDIVQYAFDYDVPKLKKKAKLYKGKIYWADEHAGWVVGPHRLVFNAGNFCRCEVIGNIFENPELLR
jgi:uncharacterized phage protein (TIGR01671 family)